MAQTAQAHIDSLVTGGQANALALQELAQEALDRAESVANSNFILAALPSLPGPNFQAGFSVETPPQFVDTFDRPLPVPVFNRADLQPFYQAALKDVPAPPDDIDTDDLFEASRPGANQEGPPSEPTDVHGGLFVAPPVSLDHVQLPEFESLAVPPPPSVGNLVFDAESPGLPPTLDRNLEALYNTTLEGKMPLFRTVVDDATAAFVQAYYPGHASGMVGLEARISTDLAGGTGYSATVRQALLDAARSEIAKGLVNAERSAFEAAARRGFVLPSGAVGAAVLDATRDANDRTARAEMEIVKQTADQEQSNAQNAIQVSLSLRTAVSNSAVQFAGLVLRTNEQALTAANQIVGVVVEAYGVQVSAYRSTLDFYSAKIRLFEISTRAAMVEIELFEAKIKGEELKARINDARIAKMRASVDAQENKIRLFEANHRITLAELERRRLVVQVYGEEIRAYVARLGAKNAEFDAYAASLRGDETLLRARLATYEKYSSEVQGVVGFNQVEGQKQGAVSDYNKAVIAQFDSEWAEYRSRFDVEKVNHDSQLQDHVAQVEFFRERIRQLSTEGELNLRAEVAKADHTLRAAALQLDRNKTNSANTMAKFKRVSDAYSAGASAFAGMAEAALSGLLAGAVEEHKVTEEVST